MYIYIYYIISKVNLDMCFKPATVSIPGVLHGLTKRNPNPNHKKWPSLGPRGHSGREKRLPIPKLLSMGNWQFLYMAP